MRKSLGDDAYTIRVTPRKRKSIWSTINVAKIAALTKAGKMSDPEQRLERASIRGNAPASASA